MQLRSDFFTCSQATVDVQQFEQIYNRGAPIELLALLTGQGFQFRGDVDFTDRSRRGRGLWCNGGKHRR